MHDVETPTHPTVAVKIGGVSDPDTDLTAPADWHSRILALAPYVEFGPNYTRGAAEALHDMSRSCRWGESVSGYDHLLRAEAYAARTRRVR